jgi:membrane associated rhomboid family serine protease
MFPIRSRQRRYRFPFVTIALIVCNLLVFYWELLQGPALPDLITVLGLRPAFFLSYWWVPSPYVWLPLVSSMFLHGGWLHLGGNMLFLWVFGGNVEDRLGHVRFLAFYFLAGFAAAFTQVFMLFDSAAPVIGASGAIAGVLGGYLVMFPRARVLTMILVIFFPLFFDLPAIFLLLFWFVSQFASGIASLETGEALYGGVAYWGHIGGFIAGAILALLFDLENYSAQFISGARQQL